MHVDKTGTGYQIYVQNSYYYDKEKQGDNISSEDLASIDKYLNSVVDSMPELKGVSPGEINIHVLPDASLGADNTINTAADDIIGVVPFQYSYSGDINFNGSTASLSNWSETDAFDTVAALKVKDRIAEMYKNSNGFDLKDELMLLDKFLSNGGILHPN
jgi:hypothetical protein